MKKILWGLALAGLSLGSAVPSHAAKSADLKINGRITPPACNLSFTGAIVDFGTRTFGSLEPGGTILPTQTTTMNIVCDGPTRVSFSAIDNRPGTAIASTEVTVWPTLGSTYDRAVWGLGTTGNANAKIGALEVAIPSGSILVDGKNLTTSGPLVLVAPIDSSTWAAGGYSSLRDVIPGRQLSVGSTDYLPQAFSNLSVPLQLSAVIARPAMLPAEDEIILDGSMTFTLRYL